MIHRLARARLCRRFVRIGPGLAATITAAFAFFSLFASATRASAASPGAGAVANAAAESAAATATSSTPPPILWAQRFDVPGPLDWIDPQKHSTAELSRVYSIRREGDHQFLHACYDATAPSPPHAMHLGKSFADHPIPLEQIQSFRWRWRAIRHPQVTDDPWLDLAAGIYVIIKPPGLFSRGRGFKFGWLSKPGPTGTHQRGLLQVPVRSDPASNVWRSESVDLCALYRREYGPCEGQHVMYIGVTTDADGTDSVAEGDYADFELIGVQ